MYFWSAAAVWLLLGSLILANLKCPDCDFGGDLAQVVFAPELDSECVLGLDQVWHSVELILLS